MDELDLGSHDAQIMQHENQYGLYTSPNTSLVIIYKTDGRSM